MITGVDHVQVAAPPGSEDAARAFYGELLGLEELPKPERLRARGGVWFAVGDQELHVGIEGDDFRPAWKAHPALAVSRASDLRALARRLDHAGHKVRWDGPRFYVADPFGNRLELLAPHAEVRVRALRDDERAWAKAVLDERWGEVAVGGGRELRPAEYPALVAEADGERAGLLTYSVDGTDCEIVSIDALTVGAGIGGALIEAAVQTARAAGATRVHLITTNDNLPALRLYQRHEFVLVELRSNQLAISRRLKPEISETGHAGIPLRDELVLERML
jgi:ribosomal protein S18 acetylase RimI-like enzyme